MFRAESPDDTMFTDEQPSREIGGTCVHRGTTIEDD